MNWKELATVILSLPTEQQSEVAGVWPPGDCPAAGFIPIEGLGQTPGGKPVMTTGKLPVVGNMAATGQGRINEILAVVMGPGTDEKSKISLLAEAVSILSRGGP